jgi:hypothetical protein
LFLEQTDFFEVVTLREEIFRAMVGGRRDKAKWLVEKDLNQVNETLIDESQSYTIYIRGQSLETTRKGRRRRT